MPSRLGLRRFGIAAGVLGGGGSGLLLNFSDDFSTLKPQWTGATWASSGSAVNTPTAGANLAANGDMETGSPPSSWTATSSANLASVADPRTGSAGTKCLGITNGAADYGLARQTLTTAAGDWIRLRGWGKKMTANGVVSFRNGTNAAQAQSLPISAGNWEEFRFCLRAGGTGWRYFLGGGDNALGREQRYDDVVAEKLTLTDLFRSIQYGSANFGLASIDVTCISGLQGGLVLNLDDPANPQNFILVYTSSTNLVTNERYLYVDKCVAGTYTNLIKATITYNDAGTIQAKRSGTTYQFFYRGAQAGVDQVIADAGIVDNKYFGLFSTDPSVTLDNFSISQTNHKLGLIGDSITASFAGGWSEILVSALNAQGRAHRRLDHSQGGCRIQQVDAHPYMAQQATAAASDDADEIIIELGTNDEVADDTLRATFEANVNVLKASNPRAAIYCIGILPRSYMDLVPEKRAIIQTACANTGVIYWSADDWIDPATETSDGTHPTAAGHAKIAAEVLARL